MKIFQVWLIDVEDESYSCDYTVIAKDEDEAKIFAETQNPGKTVTKVEFVSDAAKSRVNLAGWTLGRN